MIRQLKCFDEVYQRITDGWPLATIARYIQETKKELVTVARQTVISQLQAYRATIPPGELVKSRLPKKHAQAVEKIENGLDELAELEKLYRLQMKRVGIDYKHEKNIKKLMPTTGQEIRIAREILNTYAQHKMDLGLSKRHIGSMEVEARLLADVAVRYNPEVQKVMSDAQSRQKVLSLAERLLARAPANLAAAEPETITVEAEPVLPTDELLPDDLTSDDDVDTVDPIDGPIDT